MVKYKDQQTFIHSKQISKPNAENPDTTRSIISIDSSLCFVIPSPPLYPDLTTILLDKKEKRTI